MSIFDLKEKHPNVEFKMEPRRIVTLCKCANQPSLHRRVFEFEVLNDVTLEVIDKDLEKHEHID